VNVTSPLLESAWAERIGWALVHSVWQVAIVAAVYAVAAFALRRRSAALRYMLGCTALGMMLVWPLATFLRMPLPVLAMQREPAGAADDYVPPSLPEAVAETAAKLPVSPPLVRTRELPELQDILAAGLGDWHRRLEHALPWLSALWLAGVVMLAVRPLWGLVVVRRLMTRGLTPLSKELRLLAGRTMARLRVIQMVQFAESALVEVPTLVGYFRPMVLLPASAVTGLSTDELEMVIAHELAHVRRHDYLVNLLQTVIEALLFYHPGMWWVSGQVRRERENCCDDVAVAMCGDRSTYIRALYTMETRRAAAAPALAASGGSLVDRVRRLVFGPQSTSTFERTSAWLAGLIVLGGVMLLLSLAQTRAEESPIAAIQPAPPKIAASDSDPLLAERLQLIELLRAQGGRVEIRHDGNPGSNRPADVPGGQVLEVQLRNAAANDETLHKLKLFPQLRILTLFGTTSVTDKGLAAIVELPALENFQVQSERITDDGLRALEAAHKLQFLSLQGKGITDEGLTHVSKLQDLQFINLAHTSVTGSGLKYLADLRKLDDLRIVGDRVEDEQLVQLKGWPLRLLSVGTRTTDAGLKTISQLPKLEGLWVYSTRVTGDGVRELASLDKLKQLHISGGKVTDDDLKFLAGRKQMMAVGFDGTQVDGSFLKYLAGSNVETVGLVGTHLDERYLSYLLQLPKLQHLSLGIQGNGDEAYDLTEASLPILSQLRNLRSLFLRSNHLAGDSPEFQELKRSVSSGQVSLFNPNSRGGSPSAEAKRPSRSARAKSAPTSDDDAAPLPPLPTLDSLADKSQIEKHLDESLDEIRKRRAGHVIVGRVQVEGDAPPTDVNAQMEILGGGYFAGPTRDLERPVGFRLHGYAPYDLKLSGKSGKVVDVGTIHMKRLGDAELSPIAGRVELEGGGDLQAVSLRLSIQEGPVNTPSNGTEPRPNWPDPIEVPLDAAGRFYKTGFSPASYYLTVTAPGCVKQGRKVEFHDGEITDLGTIRLERPRRIEIEYILAKDLPFHLDEAKSLVLEGGSHWQTTPHQYRWDLEFKQKNGQLSFAWSYGPIYLADLGPGTLGDYLKIGGGAAQNPPNQVALVNDHVYLLRRPDWEHRGEDLVLFKLHTNAAQPPVAVTNGTLRQPSAAIPPAVPSPSEPAIDRLDGDGFSQLHRAASGGHEARVRELLQQGANVDVEQRTYHGTPLQYAAAGGHGDTVQALLENHATVDARDTAGRTPLLWAATNGHAEVVGRLLDADANINAAAKGGWTALHYAVDRGHVQTAQLLIDRGANLHAKNSQGKTPFDLNPGLDLRVPWKALRAESEMPKYIPSLGSSAAPSFSSTTKPAEVAKPPRPPRFAGQVMASVKNQPILWRDLAPSPEWLAQRAEHERQHGNTRGYESPDDYSLGRLRERILRPLVEEFKKEHVVEPTEAEIAEFIVHLRQARIDRRRESAEDLARRKQQLQADRARLESPDLPPQARKLLLQTIAGYEAHIAQLKKLPASPVPEMDAEHEQFFAKWYLGNWKLQQALYKEYGGRAIFQQVGPEALDAMRDLLKQREREGYFTISDPELHDRFWEYFVNDRMHVFIPDPDRIFKHPWSPFENARAAAKE
jgi:beta-lactamase regulating signal transducer with metallopeptidase domain